MDKPRADKMKDLALSITKFDNCMFKLAVASSNSPVELTDYGPYKHLPMFTQNDLSALIGIIGERMSTKLQSLSKKMDEARNDKKIKFRSFGTMCHVGYGRIFDKMASSSKNLRNLSKEAKDIFNDVSEAVDAISTWAGSVHAGELVTKTIRADLWKDASDYIHQVIAMLSVFTEFANMSEQFEKIVVGRLTGMTGDCSKEGIQKAMMEVRKINIVQAMPRYALPSCESRRKVMHLALYRGIPAVNTERRTYRK